MAQNKPLTFTYPNSGILLHRKAEGKSPNYSGGILIADEVLEYIISRYKAKEPVILDLAAWNKESNAGNSFISVSIKKPYNSGNASDKDFYSPSKTSVKPTDDEDIPF